MIAMKPRPAATALQTPAFEVRHLTVAYHETMVLDDVSALFRPGRLTAIVGPNGAGKSTLIKAALGLVHRLAGSIYAFGEPYLRADGRVGYVPQRESVDWDFPISVLELALMGTYGRLGWFRRPGRDERDKALQALEAVDLADLQHRQIGELSGGQQQRAFLARALAQNASIYLMDEPFAGVDAATERAIVSVLHRMRNEGKTVVAVHHELDSVAEHFDDALLLNRRVVASGPVLQSLSPEHVRIAYHSNRAHLPSAFLSE